MTSNKLKTFQMDVTNSHQIKEVCEEVERRIPSDTGKLVTTLCCVAILISIFLIKTKKMASSDIDKVAAILVEMGDSQASPPISPIKSPAKRTTSDSEEDFPSSQQPPAPKRQKTEEGFRTLRNKIASLETRRVNSLKFLSVLEEHVSKRSCPIGLQFRPRPQVRPDPEFTAATNKICQTAEQDLLKLLIRQQEKNASADSETISSLKVQLAALFPDQNKHEQAERRLQSTTSRLVNRNTARQKSASRRQKPNDELRNLKAKLDELTTLMNVFSKRENKTRVAIYSGVSFTDSARATPARLISKSKKRQLKRKAHKIQYTPNNDRYIKNLSNIALTDNDKALLSKGLNYIPTPPNPASNKSLIRDFNQFTRTIRLKYIFANSRANLTRSMSNLVGSNHHNRQWH